ncbi:MAG: oligosaccharide flippase family protein [candidate division KSB1 bacterium]|nr:oligosaccharide flippase family protein [candidate division KSB1 bacterium]
MAEEQENYLLTTGKHSLIYGLGTVAAKLVGLVLLPLYSKSVPVEEFGLYGLLEVLSQVLVQSLALGLPVATFRYLRLAKTPQESRKVVSTSLAGIAAATLILLPGVFYLEFRVLVQAGVLELPSSLEQSRFAWILALQLADVAFTCLLGVPLNLLRLEGRAGAFTILSLIRFASVLVLNLITVGSLGMGVLGIFLSQAVSSLLAFLGLVPYVAKRSALGVDGSLLGQMIGYGLPLVPVSLSVLLLNIGNRYVVSAFGGLEDVARYTFLQRIGGSLNMFLFQPFQLGYFPMLWRVWGTPQLERFQSRSMTYFTLAGVWITLGLALFSQEIVRVLLRNPVYWSDHDLVPIVALSFVIYGMSYVAQASFHLTGKTYWIALLFVAGMFLNLCLSWLTVPTGGVRAAALAILASYVLVLVASLPLAARYHRFHYERRRLALVALVGAAISLAATWVGRVAETGAKTGILLRLLLLGMFPLVLGLFRFYTRDERKYLVRLKEVVGLAGK